MMHIGKTGGCCEVRGERFQSLFFWMMHIGVLTVYQFVRLEACFNPCSSG